ncbi:MAG: 2-C-methyl-D-erythritol 4-phosphate cytidylyltransferase [Omnitrophica bacterium]|nr:2-C-methyl-D-erythritol 4-phosphate cytidylyltransferase [Candidatus Omnitrophota bacterium]
MPPFSHIMRFNVGAVIVCAGKGIRLRETDKAILNLGIKPLFWHSVNIFNGIKEIKQIVLVLNRRNFRLANKVINKKRVLLVEGGKRRKDSVFNGLSVLKKDISHVLIHDGARPFVSKLTVLNVIKALKRQEAVICGIKSPDTLKLVGGGFVKKTLDRKNIFFAQTPQGFEKDLILSAYKKFKKINFTDEAQIIELMGRRVKVIESDSRNFKITYPGDILLAKALVSYKR